ncbi:uncharacterized protein LOC116846491 isoform X2 [Odontomachus brunneus]|uniref:uncharacterized protein LOC116846491 isoform X2 n=1 Tax=Odontomachus brunneus TaxID=486640 RepID=UPI0013F1DA05|nr:uncharacterized protein LOC116846491 isoform X2 [Odontomachus brunneus]
MIMNGFKIWALQDLSHILSIKFLQQEAHVPSNMLKRRFWNFLDFFRKEKIAKVDSLKTAVHRTWTLPEVVATFLGFRSPAHILHLETSAKIKHIKALVPFTKYNGSSLLDENPISRNAHDRAANLTNRNPSSFSPRATRRVFSSKSCTVLQRSVKTMAPSTKGSNGMPNTNVSIVPLRGTRSHSGYVSLTRVRSFSCNTSKPWKPADCKDDNQQKSQSRRESESERKICGEKTLRKGTCGQNNASSRDDTCGKRRRSNLKTCSDRRADLQKEKKCNAGEARCCSGKKIDCNTKGRCSTRNSISSSDTDARRCRNRQSKSSCERKEDSAICTDSSKKEIDCFRESKCGRQRTDDAICGKVLRERLKKNRFSGRRRDCSRSSSNKRHKSGCSSGKRRYSQLSFLSNYPQSHAPFGVLISDTVRGVRTGDATRRLYASCDKDKKNDSRSNSLSEKPKETCETTKMQERKEKICTKGPAKCVPRKSVPDKSQICDSTSREKKPCELSQRSSTCSREQYCANRKGLDAKKDQSTEQPEETREESVKERVEREFKEMNECKKHRDKKDKRCRRSAVESKTASETCDQSKKDNTRNFTGSIARLRSALNELSFSSPISRSGVVRDESAIIARNVGSLDVMFDRSFYTTKAYQQDDSAVKRSADHSGTLPSSVNGGDFIHGDELPLFIEVENNEEEEADERIDRSSERD